MLEELDARHLRHALVGDDEGNRVASLLEAAQRVDRRCTRLGTDDTVAVGVAASEVAIDSTKHFRIVVDGEEDRSHVRTLLAGARVCCHAERREVSLRHGWCSVIAD